MKFLAPTTVETASPTGVIMPFSKSNASAPAGWLLCDGSQKSQTVYASLFAVIGSTYNTGGETSGNFRVPDLRGRSAVGLDNLGGSDAGRLDVSNTVGGSGGTQYHTLNISQMPNHNHTILGYRAGPNNNYYGAIEAYAPGGDGSTTTAYEGGGQPHNNMPPYLLLSYIIKA